MAKCLMLASGRAEPKRRIQVGTSAPEWTTLDIDPDVGPDYVADLDSLAQGHHLPFGREAFDEIHIYETVHMYGKQGDFQGWFNEFAEYWRILKPGGLFCATCPAVTGEWAWADPGCTRMIHPVNIRYLTKGFYDNLGKQPLTDYRKYVKGWWRIALRTCGRGMTCLEMERRWKKAEARADGNAELCPCGSRQFRPANPRLWEELLFPGIWRLWYHRVLKPWLAAKLGQ
jgi:SAM-dependent methyltransferase